MRQDVITLENFYTTRLGKTVSSTLADRVRALWGPLAKDQLLGFGFATPLLQEIGQDADMCMAAMPGAQGALTWSNQPGLINTVLCEEERLPFCDTVFSHLIVMHGLEEAYAPQRLLQECWRIMAPEGRILIIATNRLGLWSHAEHTPFGQGRPWSKQQLINALSDARFQMTAWSYSLHFPPISWSPALNLHGGWEKIGDRLTRFMGGVILIEAKKRLHAAPHNRVMRFAPGRPIGTRKGLAHTAQKEGIIHMRYGQIGPDPDFD